MKDIRKERAYPRSFEENLNRSHNAQNPISQANLGIGATEQTDENHS